MEEKKEAEQTPPQPNILDQVKEYVETRVLLAKYQAIEKGSSVAASLAVIIVIVLALLLTFLFGTFTLALFLGDVMGATWKGFGVVALFYLLISVIMVAAKSSFEKPIINLLISKLFK
ncbi:phage holin family protein [Mucilaginibacter daejeonensis]|uniref:phage holin family protein n=1 Tax=Mucilaginibacter daejeonensis TaxID=398049 RepID=UPI001D171CEA|nr:phage holin family protein [Mucilaginibacter daejeonensis]UEG53171.1 phage holin family protein [Mucilaginibacter daejeonensis]